MKGNRTGKGYYTPKGSEPLSKQPIAVRLPQSIDAKLRLDLELSGAALLDYVRQAVAEKLDRDAQAGQLQAKD